MIDSGLFIGTLRHRRFAPIAHAFTYPLFMALLDVDLLPELMRVSWVTGYNRFNWASFHDRDHLGDPGRPLLRHPAMTAQVVAGIHWQALRLWWKGVPLVRRVTRDGVGERAAYAAETASRTESVVER